MEQIEAAKKEEIIDKLDEIDDKVEKVMRSK